MCPSVTPEALLNDKIKRERGDFMSKYRGRKRSDYISEMDKIMHNLNELFHRGQRRTMRKGIG